MMHHTAPIRRLMETLGFFRAYGWTIAIRFLPLYLPVVALNLLLPSLGGDPQQKASYLGLSYLIHFLYQPIYTGALIYWLSRIEAGAAWSLREGFVLGVTLWDRLLLVSLITHMWIVLGALAFIVPGLIAYARLSLAEFRVVLRGESAREAIRGSFRMTRPVAWEILASSLVLFLLFLAFELLFAQVNAKLSGGLAVELLMSSLLSILLLISLTILLFRFYGLTKGPEADLPDTGDAAG
jgi:hypothetical protein